jgi:cytochrome c biogenesis protein ResB
MAPNPVKPRRLIRALDGLWYAGSAPHTLMALAVLLAGTLAVAAIIPQQPAGLSGAAVEQWLAGTAGSYRDAGSFLRAVGAFHLTGGPWMRVLLAALALSLMLRVANQAGFLYRLWRSPAPLAAPPRLIVHRATLPGAPEAIVDQLPAALRPRFSSMAVESNPDGAQVYLVRRPAGAVGPLLTYAGPLLILLGLLLNEALGWRAGDIALAPGGSSSPPAAQGLKVTLAGIYGEDAASTTLRLAEGTRTREVHTAANRPARLGNVWLTQQEIGPALVVTAEDRSGRPVEIQALTPGSEIGERLPLLFRQTQSEQAFALPARNLTFRAVSYPALPERNISAPVFLVEAYRGADPAPVLEALVEDTAMVSLDDVTLTLGRDRYVTLEAADLPGLPLLLLGVTVLLAGVIVSSVWGPTRAWIGMAADGDVVELAVRAAAATEPERELARIAAACSHRSPHPAAAPEVTDAG